jgi:hypothetical protein
VAAVSTTGKTPVPAPLTGPMISQLGAYAMGLRPHELALRCRQCSEVFRSSEGGETHRQLREHWAGEHRAALAALAPRPPAAVAVEAPQPAATRAPAPSRTGPLAPTVCAAPDCTEMVVHPFPHPVARPALYCSTECLERSRRARQSTARTTQRRAAGVAPRPVVQRAKGVVGVKQSAPPTPAPQRTPMRRTCAAPFCDTVMTTGTRACCSQVCKNRKYRADHGVAVHPPKTEIAPVACPGPGCDQVVVQHPRGAVRVYCSPVCMDRARAARRRAARASVTVTCAAQDCSVTFEEGPYGRRFCSGRCKQRATKARPVDVHQPELVSA